MKIAYMFYYLMTKQELQTISMKMEFTPEQKWVWYLHAEHKGRREPSERDRGCCNCKPGSVRFSYLTQICLFHVGYVSALVSMTVVAAVSKSSRTNSAMKLVAYFGT